VADRVRIEIGFDGGQVMSALVESDAVDRLERALGSGEDGSLALEVEDGRYTVSLGRIVYETRFAREGRVGFGA
jgi:exopolysaccharide biosynthesis protein